MRKTTAILLCLFCFFLSKEQMATRTKPWRIINAVNAGTVRLESLWEFSDNILTDYCTEAGLYLARQTKTAGREAQFLFTLGKKVQRAGTLYAWH